MVLKSAIVVGKYFFNILPTIEHPHDFRTTIVQSIEYDLG